MSLQRKSAEHVVVVSVNDPALDRHGLAAQIALRKYATERGDVETLHLLPGAVPTRFVLRPLRHHVRTWIEGYSSESARYCMAFCAALDRIEDPNLNWTKREKDLPWGNGATVIDPDAMAELGEMIGSKVIEEIGAVALQRANMTADQKKAFWLPRGCEVDWAIGSPATGPLATAVKTSRAS